MKTAAHVVQMQTIRERYPRSAVEVVFAISGADDAYRSLKLLARFNHLYEIEYTGLDDKGQTLVSQYRLKDNPQVVSDAIIDIEGIVRHVGKFTPAETMIEKIDSLLSGGREPDLSTPDKAIAALKAPEAYARWKAARALGTQSDSQAIEPLIEALQDESETVRECAAEALRELGDEVAAEPLLALLDDPSPWVRQACIGALGNVGGTAVVEPLIGCLSDKSPQIRRCAARALGTLGDERAAEPLVAALNEAVVSVQLAAIQATGQLKTPLAIPTLVTQLADSGLREAAAEALGAIGQPEAVKTAVEANRDRFDRLAKRERAQVNLCLVRVYGQSKAFDDAAAHCRQTAALSPSLAKRAHEALGDAYRADGRMAEALTEYDKVVASYRKKVERNTRNTYSCNMLAAFYVRKDVRHKDMLKFAEMAVRNSPSDISYRDTLGWAYLRNGQFDKALDTFVEVFAVNPKFDPSWQGVAEIARSSVDSAAFAKFCETMAKTAAHDPIAKSRLERVRAEFEKHRQQNVRTE